MRHGSFDTDDRPLVLIWELTQACGLTCDHCRADAQTDRHPDELSTAEGKRLLEEVAEFADGQLVVPSGGDPLCPYVPEGYDGALPWDSSDDVSIGD